MHARQPGVVGAAKVFFLHAVQVEHPVVPYQFVLRNVPVPHPDLRSAGGQLQSFRQLSYLLRRPVALGDVAHDGDEAGLSRAGSDALQIDLHRHVHAVFAPVDGRKRLHPLLSAHERRNHRPELRLIEFRLDVERRHAQQFLPAVPHLLHGPLVHVAEPQRAGIEDERAVPGGIQRLQRLVDGGFRSEPLDFHDCASGCQRHNGVD